MPQSMKTVPVQIVCRKCSNPYRTQVRGGNSRCPHCRTSRYVRQDQEWEGPVPTALTGVASRAEAAAARLPVWCTCGCGYEWQSRAKDHQRLRCPSCGTGVRVPLRTYDNTEDTPTSHHPAPVPYRPPAPRRHLDPEPPDGYDDDPEEWEGDDQEENPPTLAEGLRSLQNLLDSFRTPVLPTPARQPAIPARPAPQSAAPAPVRRAPARRPVLAPPVHRATAAAQSRDEEKDRRRRDNVCALVRSLSGNLLVWYDTPARMCEILDTNQPRDRQRCRGMASRAVVFVGAFAGEVTAYACPAHAGPLANLANTSPGIAATVVSVNV